MVDVPRALDPSDAERLDVLRRAMTAGNVDGESRAVGPIFRRDQVQAAVGGGTGGDDVDSTDSMIDRFPITGTGTSVFTLTFDPVEDSWNVSCSWPLDDTDDYTIDGQTLTIIDPATVFIGASGTYPKTLQVQYDYLTGVPTAPSQGDGVTDNFNRANGAVGTSSSGYVWDVTEGSPAIVSNQLLLPGVPGSTIEADLGTSDFSMQATLIDAGFLPHWQFRFRIVDGSNYLVCQGGTVDVVTAGAFVTAFSLSSGIGAGDTLRIDCVGDTVTVYKNGSSVGSGTVTAFDSATRVGLTHGINYQSTWDDFSAVPL